jgi:hypothetical protein
VTLRAAAPAAPAAPGPVTVVFEHPEKFTDVRENWGDNENEQGSDHYLPLLREHLEKNAARRLAPGQQLAITFTDIDLAGDFEPWRGLQFDQIRVVKEIYIPRLTFSYKVTDASGTVVKSGDCKLLDMGFQMRITPGFRDDPLRYEKAMLDDWLSQEFRTPKA